MPRQCCRASFFAPLTTGIASNGAGQQRDLSLCGICEGITGVQAGIQTDSCGSDGSSETADLQVSVDVRAVTALAPRLRIPPSPPNTPQASRLNAPIYLNARYGPNLTDLRYAFVERRPSGLQWQRGADSLRCCPYADGSGNFLLARAFKAIVALFSAFNSLRSSRLSFASSVKASIVQARSDTVNSVFSTEFVLKNQRGLLALAAATNWTIAASEKSDSRQPSGRRQKRRSQSVSGCRGWARRRTGASPTTGQSNLLEGADMHPAAVYAVFSPVDLL